MKYILFALILLTVYGLYSWFKLVHVVKSANLPQITQNQIIMGTGPSLKYVAAGDSTTQGEGASSVEQTYPYRLLEFFAQTNQVEYTNLGVKGARFADFITDQLPEIIKLQPDIVTVSIGANDRTHLTSNKQIFSSYQIVINEILNKTSATLYIADIPNFSNATLLPLPYRYYLEKQTAKLLPQLKQFESNRVKIVNVHDYGWDSYPDISVTFAADQFHPNDEGYNNWANAFINKIEQ